MTRSRSVVPPKFDEPLFEPFAMAKQGGMGLGLHRSVDCRCPLRANLATNIASGGAAFHFTLPAVRHEGDQSGAGSLAIWRCVRPSTFTRKKLRAPNRLESQASS